MIDRGQSHLRLPPYHSFDLFGCTNKRASWNDVSHDNDQKVAVVSFSIKTVRPAFEAFHATMSDEQRPVLILWARAAGVGILGGTGSSRKGIATFG